MYLHCFAIHTIGKSPGQRNRYYNKLSTFNLKHIPYTHIKVLTLTYCFNKTGKSLGQRNILQQVEHI